jgi:hypothetical protein
MPNESVPSLKSAAHKARMKKAYSSSSYNRGKGMGPQRTTKTNTLKDGSYTLEVRKTDTGKDAGKMESRVIDRKSGKTGPFGASSKDGKKFFDNFGKSGGRKGK